MVLDSYYNSFDIEYCMLYESCSTFNTFVIFILYFVFNLCFTLFEFN